MSSTIAESCRRSPVRSCARDSPRSSYEGRWRQILFPDQATLVSRVNSAVERLVDPQQRRRADLSQTKLLAEINERIDSVLTPAQKKELGRGAPVPGAKK